MTTTIFFMRHGQVYNPKHILYGRLPRFGLSKIGRKQAQTAAEFFKKQNLSTIYSSPLLRTRQTAKIIADICGLKPKVSSLINEDKLFCDGVSLDYYHQKLQENLYSRENIAKGQESIEHIERRMKRFINIVLNKHNGGKILAVSHGDPIMILNVAVLKIPFTFEYKKNNYLQTGMWITIHINGNKLEIQN